MVVALARAGEIAAVGICEAGPAEAAIRKDARIVREGGVCVPRLQRWQVPRRRTGRVEGVAIAEAPMVVHDSHPLQDATQPLSFKVSTGRRLDELDALLRIWSAEGSAPSHGQS